MDDPSLELPPAKRPVAVTVAAWTLMLPAIAGGVIVTLGFLFMLTGFAAFAGGGRVSLGLIPLMLLGMVLTLLPAVLLVLLGIALLRMRPWARTVTIVVCGLLVLMAIGPVIYGQRPPVLQILAGLAIPAIVLTLILLPSSGEAFREAREDYP